MRLKKVIASRPREMTIVIAHDLRKPMSMEAFILSYLASIGGGSAYVHEMFKSFNDYRVNELHKKPGKYASFRAIISEMHADTMHRDPSVGKRHYPYIQSTTKDRGEFEPSAYRIVDYGIKRLQSIRDSA